MLVYLHGFNSSPASHKAQLMKAHMEGLGLGHLYACPALPDTPREAIVAIETAIEGCNPREITFLGSSLGGYYATSLAQRLGCRAVLINPAVTPHVGLEAYLGTQKNLHTGAPYELTRAHLDGWRALWVESIDPERYLLLLETGDEVLDWRAAARKYEGARSVIRDGGDHSLQSFPEHIGRILQFAGIGIPGMNVLYEEEGEYKAGAVLSQSPAAYQVESPHGRRSKIKASNVVLSFEHPTAAELLAQARKYADGLDTDFLWQCRKGAEFGFQDLARDYVGHDPLAVESAGVLLKLYSAPMYFYRRGRGRFQAAPEDTLRLALAGLEKKKRQQEQIAAWAAQLSRFECPPEIARLRDELLYAPDRAKGETKALEQACVQTGLSAPRLLERCGLLGDSREFHIGRFVHEFYPGGTGFPAHPAPVLPDDLPLADCVAFSLDDAGTTEIDDAFSVARMADGELRIGIHIAAPGLAFAPGSPLDAIARERLSTAYMPGEKFTMLPDDAIERLSLDEGQERPVVSLYLNVGAGDFALRGRHTKLERIRVAANLRHGAHDALNAAFEKAQRVGLPLEDELFTLWQLAQALETRRGKPSVNAANLDYVFRVEDGRVAIEARKRGAPLDKVVSELMILANNTWGDLLAEKDLAGIYRVQSSGKVRLSVHPEPHEGLGVSSYAWTTSPLRRYVDLVNQWQLVAGLRGQRPPFARNSEALLAALRAFEVATAGYDEHQRAMEHYWCLRWIEQERQARQESVLELDGVVLRENLVRFERLPLAVRVSSLPELEPGTRVRLAVAAPDLIERSVACAWRETLGQGTL